MFKKTIFQNTVNKHRTQNTDTEHRTQTHVKNGLLIHDHIIPKLGTVQSHRFHICLCIIYKTHHILAIFPLLDYVTRVTFQTQGNNIKFILPYCSKDVFKYSFLPILLRNWNALPQSSVEATSLDLFKASIPSVTY